MRKIKFVHESASCNLFINEKTGINQILDVQALRPQCGEGSAMMRNVCDYLDAQRLDVHILARPFASRALDQDQLVTFYEKFGFTQDPYFVNRYKMVRKANRRSTL